MVRVKVCGVRTRESAIACREAGVDLAGLNFVAASRRRIEVEAAPALLEELGGVQAVGLFRDTEAVEVERVADHLGLRWVQLHGSEDPREFAPLARRVRILRGCSAHGPEAERLAEWRQLGAIALVDGPRPGSGTAFAWDRLDLDGEFFIAGGLDASNVAEAIAATGCAGVDVASGVEREGRIDPGLIHEFVRRVRRATEVGS
jgi:phosphoribosylanthranilate isomerase